MFCRHKAKSTAGAVHLNSGTIGERRGGQKGADHLVINMKQRFLLKWVELPCGLCHDFIMYRSLNLQSASILSLVPV